MENKVEDLIIIGAGPAGLTAAIYARRADVGVMIIEASAPGGKMVKTAEIENWPGTKNTAGANLAFEMFDHATSLGAVYQSGNVIDIKDGNPIEVHCEDGNVYKAKALLIATGTLERKLNIPGEDKFTSKGVSYCAVCDGAFFKDQVVSVVGGGNSALEEAIYLTKFASQVNVIIRRDVFRADKLVQDEIEKNDKIKVITKAIPVEIVGDTKVSGLVIQDVETKEQKTIPTAAVFPFIGLDPITKFAQHLGITNELGYIKADMLMKTSVDGIYAAGDVNQKELRQVVTAASDGAIAAQQIIKYLESRQ